MMIEKMPLKKEPKKKGKFHFVRTSIGIGVLVFVIAFFVTIVANTRKIANDSLQVASLATWEPLPTTAPQDLVENVTINQEDDAPIPPTDVPTAAAAVPVTAESLEWAKPANGDVTNPYSESDLVYNRTMDDWRVHLGVDFGGNIGSSVFAAADGTVTDVGKDDDWGNYIVITHIDGYVSKYCNLQDNPPVQIGDKVTMGQVIGGMDRTAGLESADPPHLHFEVTLNGAYIDPMSLFE